MAAIGWGLALLVGAATLPFYSGMHVSVACPGCPEVTSTDTQTLLEVNGARVLIVVGIPLLIAALVTLTLWSGRPSVAAAWVLVGLLWLLTLLAMLSIGFFFVPATLLLTLAAALGRQPPSKAAPAPTV
jgi:hypothetical protein